MNKPRERSSAADSVGAAAAETRWEKLFTRSTRSSRSRRHRTLYLATNQRWVCLMCVPGKVEVVGGQREAIGSCRSYFVAMHAVAERRFDSREPAVEPRSLLFFLWRLIHLN